MTRTDAVVHVFTHIQDVAARQDAIEAQLEEARDTVLRLSETLLRLHKRRAYCLEAMNALATGRLFDDAQKKLIEGATPDFIVAALQDTP